MALKQCKECGKEVSNKAEKCPHCGARVKRKPLGCGGLILAIIILSCIGYIINNITNTKTITPTVDISTSKNKVVNNRDRLELTQGQIDLISKLQNQRLLSIKPKFNEAYIAPGLWSNMKFKVKENFAAALAIYCGNKKGTYLYWVNIYDQYSGKKLAKYSQNWGFKVYK